MSIGGSDPLALLGAGSAKILVFVQDGLGGPWPRAPSSYAYVTHSFDFWVLILVSVSSKRAIIGYFE